MLGLLAGARFCWLCTELLSDASQFAVSTAVRRFRDFSIANAAEYVNMDEIAPLPVDPAQTSRQSRRLSLQLWTLTKQTFSLASDTA